FHDRPVHQIFAAHMTEAPAPVASKRSDVPRELARLVMRCLEKEASKRPQSAREVLQVLDGATSNPRGAARAQSPKRVITTAVTLLVVVAAGTMLARTYFRSASTGQTDRSIAVLPFAIA